MEKHDLAEYVRILARGKNASRHMTLEEAHYTMSNMLKGNYRPEQLGAIFMLMRVLEENAEEIAGFAKAINEYFPAELEADLIWASYAGKRRQPFWSLLSALLLSEMGYKILFHGSLSHTEGRVYLHEVFEQFGLPQLKTTDEFSQFNIAYLPCSAINPRLQDWLLLKSVLGVRSPINTVLKTISPDNIPSVQGIFHPNYRALHCDAARQLGHDALVIKGEGGEFEVNPERKCVAMYNFNGEQGEISIANDQSLFEDKPNDPSPQHLLNFWRGEMKSNYANQAVLKTAALALCAIEKNSDYFSALTRCEQAWQQRNINLL
ncbi:hypothetical protein A3759_16695 [Thalassolituus sp. HI0120]|nr:hypothetical protein A3759_16695 [Thalassolituus sp. HI0120]